MKHLIFILCLITCLSACSKKQIATSAALPDNVTKDKPIILKEGQAVIIMKEGDLDLMVGIAVADGKLSVAEIDPNGRNFGVTWKDSETWETATMISTTPRHSTTVMDRDGDGHADFKAIRTHSGLQRFELKNEEWIELKSNKNKANKAQ